MMNNQIKELKNNVDEDFIIEISLFLLDIHKKLIISLFIRESISVLELKEFISKDFRYPIESMIIFSPIRGIVQNNYIFQAEPNKKIVLDLILDKNKIEKEKKNNVKIENYESKTNFSEKVSLNSQTNQKNLTKHNHFNNNNNFPVNINNFNFDPNENNKTKDVKLLDDKKILVKPELKIKNSEVDFKQVNNKFHFKLNKIDDDKKVQDNIFLSKKRFISKTFKTTLFQGENRNKKSLSQKTSSSIGKNRTINFNIVNIK